MRAHCTKKTPKETLLAGLSQSPVAVLQLLVFPFRNLHPSTFLLMTLRQTSSQLFLATMNFLSHLSQSLAAWLVRAKH